jgi:hypothetical protein
MIVIDLSGPLGSPCSVCGQPIGQTVALLEPRHAQRTIVVPESLGQIVNNLEVAPACVVCGAETDQEGSGYLRRMRESGLA